MTKRQIALARKAAEIAARSPDYAAAYRLAPELVAEYLKLAKVSGSK